MAYMSEVEVGQVWRCRIGGRYCDCRVEEVISGRGRTKFRLYNLTTKQPLHKARTASFLRKRKQELEEKSNFCNLCKLQISDCLCRSKGQMCHCGRALIVPGYGLCIHCGHEARKRAEEAKARHTQTLSGPSLGELRPSSLAGHACADIKIPAQAKENLNGARRALERSLDRVARVLLSERRWAVDEAQMIEEALEAADNAAQLLKLAAEEF